MNYTEIKTTALAYADRNSAEINAMIDTFLPMVESRINRSLRTQNMSVRARVSMAADQIYYGLPTMFGGIRDISIHATDSTKQITGTYLNPEQMNNLQTTDIRGFYYTLIADQIQVYPPKGDTTMEVVYYKRLNPLGKHNDTSWVSERYPDLYVAGLLVEIEAYVKNPDAVNIWNQRYSGIITDIGAEDGLDRWSGTPLTTKVG